MFFSKGLVLAIEAAGIRQPASIPWLIDWISREMKNQTRKRRDDSTSTGTAEDGRRFTRARARHCDHKIAAAAKSAMLFSVPFLCFAQIRVMQKCGGIRKKKKKKKGRV